MGGDRNTVHLVTALDVEHWPQMEKAEVARRLGLGRSTLYRKVREYDLDVDQARSA